jgi:steroid 5-alpha reductase family enzyme
MKALSFIAIAAVFIAWSGSSGGVTIYSLPMMVWAVLIIFGIQCVAFLPAYLYQTERYYDLIGSLTYIVATLVVLLGSAHFDARSRFIALFIIVWAVRLGSFLFLRISQDGKDSRFDKIKPSPLLFFRTWMLQGLWVTVTGGAALAALTSSTSTPLGMVDSVAIALWVLGFMIEIIADRQKRQFRKTHGSSKFITTGLWALSRHPNYFGEIMLWSGIALLAAPALQDWQYLTLVSPLFVYVLLTRISGVVLLEYKSDRRWGEDAAYLEYKARTPQLLPKWRVGES